MTCKPYWVKVNGLYDHTVTDMELFPRRSFSNLHCLHNFDMTSRGLYIIHVHVDRYTSIRTFTYSMFMLNASS